MACHFLSVGVVEVEHLGAGLGVDARRRRRRRPWPPSSANFSISAPTAMITACCSFGSLSKTCLRHHQRLEHEPVATCRGRWSAPSTLPPGGTRSGWSTRSAPRPSRRSASPRRFRSTAATAPTAPASFSIMSISRLPPRTFMPLASSGVDERLAARRHAAGLPDPAHDHDALVGEDLVSILADFGVLPAAALTSYDVTRPGIRPMLSFRDFAARVRQRHQRHVERALAHAPRTAS